MTGFGRAEHTADNFQVKIEINSVNRKQGEVIVQMPRTLSELEKDIRKYVLTKVQRGRVQVSITVDSITSTNTSTSLSQASASPAQVDLVKATALIQAIKEIEKISGELHPITTADFLNAGDIIHLEDQQITPENAKDAIHHALESAMEKCVAMRKIEGQHMHDDISSRIQILEEQTNSIEKHAPTVAKHYKNNLHRRLTESGLELNLNDDRLLKEIGIFAERCDISEEITRLRSHFLKFREYLASPEPIGRSLDFLCQEINREFNTIGSKANDATLAQHVVNCKTELEKAREQVQNIE